jgi:hypothetical protein
VLLVLALCEILLETLPELDSDGVNVDTCRPNRIPRLMLGDIDSVAINESLDCGDFVTFTETDAEAE